MVPTLYVVRMYGTFKDFGLDIEELIDFMPCDKDVPLVDKNASEINEMLFLDECDDMEGENSPVDSVNELNFDQCDESTEIVIEEPSLGIHIRCASHTLNLVALVDAKEALKNAQYRDIHQRAFAKMKSLFLKYNRPKSYAIMQNVLNSRLVVPNKTRWNAVFDALKCFNGKDPKEINKLMGELGLEKFTTNELIFLKKYEAISKPVAAAIDNLQPNECYFSVFLPTLFTVKKSLD